MKRLRINLLAGLVLVLLACLPAQAALQMSYILDAGALTPIVLTPGFPPGTFNYGLFIGVGPIFTISGQASSNSPGTPTGAEILSSAISVANNSGGAHRLQLFVGDTGYLAPSAPPAPGLVLNSHIGGSIGSALNPGPFPGNTLAFTSCVDPTNTALSCNSPVPAGVFSAGPATPGVTVGSFADDQFASILALGTPYSMSQYFDFHMDANSQMGFQSNTVLSPVPEPVSIALLGGVLVMTSGLIRRKAKRGTVG